MLAVVKTTILSSCILKIKMARVLILGLLCIIIQNGVVGTSSALDEDRAREECSQELDNDPQRIPKRDFYHKFLSCYWTKNLDKDGKINYDGTQKMIIQILDELLVGNEDSNAFANMIIEICKTNAYAHKGNSLTVQNCILEGIDKCLEKIK